MKQMLILAFFLFGTEQSFAQKQPSDPGYNLNSADCIKEAMKIMDPALATEQLEKTACTAAEAPNRDQAADLYNKGFRQAPRPGQPPQFAR
jgi:hypothetical protein